MNLAADPIVASASGEEDTRERSARACTRRLWAYGLAAGLLAGLAAGLAGEEVLAWLAPNMTPPSIHAPAALQRDHAALIHRAEIKQVVLAMGLLGGFLGLALGLAGGLARRSVRRAVLAAAAGLILGTGAVVGSSFCVMPSYITNKNFYGEGVLAPLLLHGALWVPVGAMGGLALGLGVGGWSRTARAVVGGLAGAALGTLVNEMASAVLFPLARTYQPLSDTWDSRVVARLTVALSSAVVAVAAGSHKVGSPLAASPRAPAEAGSPQRL